MALKKELIFENGLKIEYHYISDISVDNKNKIAKLKIDSYTDITYRDKEKLNELNKNKYEDLFQKILQENEKTEEDRDIEQVEIWSKEMNDVANFKADLVLKVVTTDIELKDVTDFNMSNLYNLLKQEELFKDAKNC